MASKLTELAVKRLRTKDTTYTRVVDGELYVRVTPKGKKVWIFRYTPPGGSARIKMSLGEITETNDLTAAKALVAKYTAMITANVGIPHTTSGSPQKYTMNRELTAGKIPKFITPDANVINPANTRNRLLYRTSKNCANVSTRVSR